MDYRSTPRRQGPVLLPVQSRQQRLLLPPVFTYPTLKTQSTKLVPSLVQIPESSVREWLGPGSQRKFKVAENLSQMFVDLVQCLRDKVSQGQWRLESTAWRTSQVNTHISAINTHTTVRALQGTQPPFGISCL